MTENTERLCVPYENLSEKFNKDVTDYNKQYCSIYLVRLKQMTKLLESAIEKKWHKTYPIIQLYKLSEEKHSKCIVIGTLFKDQKLKPSVLKQLAEGNLLVPQPIVTHFTDKSDQLFIEDELQRYQIIGAMLVDKLVTGISCALLGADDGKGKFVVEDYVFAGYQPQIPRPPIEESAYVVILSGLDLMHSEKFSINLQLLTYWISGLLTDNTDFRIEQVTRLIIAGNCIRNTAEEVKPSISMLSRKPESTDTIEAVKLLDKFLFQLTKIIDVDVMPGENDPSNHILPQKPMHWCMFPHAASYKSLNQVSNPYFCSVGGVRILGTSGQNVRDILRYSEITEPIEALERCVEWSHFAPTAPDTLGCFPFYESDPFIIEECPHVLFAGNQAEFATKKINGPDGQEVRLISVPEFSSTLQVCLLNIKTLDCRPMAFQDLL